MAGKHHPEVAKRGKKACTECRQQKARCDASTGVPCSRCRKVKAECTISDPFKRENKRQKLNDLEHEAQELRERLESIGNSDRDTSDSLKTTSIKALPASTPNTSFPTTTLQRELGDHIIEANDIDELFKLFFSEFSRYLPILNPAKTPNEYYETSPLLFWAIIGVGSRAYTRLPTLIHVVRARTSDMAFDALKAAPTLETIRALLLVITWPFPKSQGIWFPTSALLGAVLHSAMAIGLHVPTSTQEFSKFRAKLTDEDIRQRIVTWAYCVIVYQRTSICKGNSSLTLNDVCQFPKARALLYERLDDSSCFQLRLQDTATRALRAFSEFGLPDITPDQEISLVGLIDSYLVQLEELRGQTRNIVDDLDFSAVSMTLSVFHLFRTGFIDDVTNINTLFLTACQVLERFDKVAQISWAGLRALPLHHTFALLNSSIALLRLFQTPTYALYIDETRAKAMVYLAINLVKKMSIQPEDLAGRATKALTELADSKKAFKSPDGDGMPVPLRIRSRLAMSAILDGLMWWREEYGGTMGVYPTPLKSSTNGGQTNSLSGSDLDIDTLQAPFDESYDSIFSGQPWMGFEDLLSPSFMSGLLTSDAV